MAYAADWFLCMRQSGYTPTSPRQANTAKSQAGTGADKANPKRPVLLTASHIARVRGEGENFGATQNARHVTKTDTSIVTAITGFMVLTFYFII